jgi:hypothetical protein
MQSTKVHLLVSERTDKRHACRSGGQDGRTAPVFSDVLNISWIFYCVPIVMNKGLQSDPHNRRTEVLGR